MVKEESRLWKRLSDNTKHNVHWTRLESWALPGIPDLYGIREGKSFWLELKVHRLKSLNSLKLSPHQINWQVQHCAHGGSVWNLVSHPPSRTTNLFSGKRALELGGMTEKEGPLKPDRRWQSPINWSRMIEIMMKNEC